MRKKTTLKERLTACSICDHPISQRHHLLEVSRYDENDYTYQLCANCHEIYHLLETIQSYPDKTINSKIIIRHLETKMDDSILIRLKNLVQQVINTKKRMEIAFKDIEDYKEKIERGNIIKHLVEQDGYRLVDPDNFYSSDLECPCCLRPFASPMERQWSSIEMHQKLGLPYPAICYTLFPPQEDRTTKPILAIAVDKVIL